MQNVNQKKIQFPFRFLVTISEIGFFEKHLL